MLDGLGCRSAYALIPSHTLSIVDISAIFNDRGCCGDGEDSEGDIDDDD